MGGFVNHMLLQFDIVVDVLPCRGNESAVRGIKARLLGVAFEMQKNHDAGKKENNNRPTKSMHSSMAKSCWRPLLFEALPPDDLEDMSAAWCGGNLCWCCDTTPQSFIKVVSAFFFFTGGDVALGTLNK
jgi:hypothetical protein